MHIAVLMAIAQFTDWYEITWHKAGQTPEVTLRAAGTAVIAFTAVVLLSLRPVTYLLKPLLEPDISLLYSPELQKL